jgi:hypothetical protein
VVVVPIGQARRNNVVQEVANIPTLRADSGNRPRQARESVVAQRLHQVDRSEPILIDRGRATGR